MRPKVSATPTCDTAPPVTPSITIAPVPANTRQKVPKNSAISFFAILCGMRDDLHLQFQLAMLLAELFNLGANFLQCFNGQRNERSRFESGTLWYKKLTTNLVEQGCSHLAASAVMNADEKHLFLHRWNVK